MGEIKLLKHYEDISNQNEGKGHERVGKMIKVKDIYIGKPDAKDELISNKYDEFLRSFVIPDNYRINEIIEGDKCFIRGYKGTGKTALLLYLSEKIRHEEEMVCTSFVLFKSDYGSIDRARLDQISKNLISTIEIGRSTLENEQDFEYIWRWIFFQQIIEDNTEYNDGLFLFKGIKLIVSELVRMI